MNMEERGLYHTCLNFSWVNGGLPAELGELARAVKMSRPKLERLWQRVGRCFQPGPSGDLVNPRQEEERQSAIELSIKLSESGRRGGQAKGRLKPGFNEAQARAYESVYVSESVVTTEGKQTAEAAPDLDVWASSIYDRWKKYRDRVLALQALCALTCSREQFEAVYVKWLDYHERAGWNYAPTLASFLHDRTYEHEPPQLGDPARRKSAAEEAQERAVEKMKKQGDWE